MVQVADRTDFLEMWVPKFFGATSIAMPYDELAWCVVDEFEEDLIPGFEPLSFAIFAKEEVNVTLVPAKAAVLPTIRGLRPSM